MPVENQAKIKSSRKVAPGKAFIGGQGEELVLQRD